MSCLAIATRNGVGFLSVDPAGCRRLDMVLHASSGICLLLDLVCEMERCCKIQERLDSIVGAREVRCREYCRGIRPDGHCLGKARR